MNDKEITLTVSLNDANIILAALGELPFKLSAPLIDKIKSQGQAQVEAPAPKEITE